MKNSWLAVIEGSGQGCDEVRGAAAAAGAGEQFAVVLS